MNKKIVVVGTGYVGLSIATLLSLFNDVIAVDVIQDKVDNINNRISPIKDEYIEKFFNEKILRLSATLNADEDYKNADFAVIATPTNYDADKHYFDCSSVESCIEHILSINPELPIVIKSTIPLGFTKSMITKYNVGNILFSPEFLRESKALYDNLHPSRIIVSYDNKHPQMKEFAELFADLLKEGSWQNEVNTLIIGTYEAEAIKLFANTYLALRVAYFNELDTYAMKHKLNSEDIIKGISLDPRIGDYYNNPSFGYGGYCLPKDTKLLLANFQDTPQNLISAIVESNDTRKKFIADEIIEKATNSPSIKPIVGIYRLIMKSNSDNFRCSAIFDIIEMIKEAGISIVIYEPTISEDTYMGFNVIHDLKQFLFESSVIVANRYSEELKHVKDRIFTRDIFNNN